MTRRGRYFGLSLKQEYPAKTLSDKEMIKLLCGRRNVGIWIGDRIFVIDYRGKLKLCPKNHANTRKGIRKKMRKVM